MENNYVKTLHKLLVILKKNYKNGFYKCSGHGIRFLNNVLINV